MSKNMLYPCRCFDCEHSDINSCGIVCMILNPQFTDDGECLDFYDVHADVVQEGGGNDEK